VDTTNTWNVGVNFVNEGAMDPYNYWRTQIFKIEDTVSINSTDYREIIEYDDQNLNSGKLQFYVREDSTGKVFYSDGNTEIVAFDFGLKPGDSLMITPSTMTKFTLDRMLKATIDSVSTILLNNVEYDALYLTIGEEETLCDVWVRGIGSLRFGLFYPVLFMTGDTYKAYYLLCFHKDKHLVYSNEQFNECYLKTALNESVLNKKLISCIPTGDCSIKINMYNGEKGTFTLYSVAGQKVWSSFLESSDMHYKMNHSGLFLYCFESEAGKIEQGKVLIK
jgi:hypothetical protein